MTNWRERARCGPTTHELFFPTNGVDEDGFPLDDYSDEAVDEARIMCDTCPVRKECRTANWLEPYGVIDGFTPEQRGFRNGVRFKKIARPK